MKFTKDGAEIGGRQTIYFLSFVLVLFCSFVPRAERALSRFEFSRVHMGTGVRMVLYADSEQRAQNAANAAFARIAELDRALSDYREDSELMRLCGEGAKTPQKVSEDLFVVLQKSIYFSQLSKGAFDISVGPVVALWRQARRAKRLPDAAELSRAMAAVGFQNIVLNPKHKTVFLKRPDMKLDVGGIAKGYATDQALFVLKSHGIKSALIDAGGDMTAGAPPPGKKGWTIAVAHPDPAASELEQQLVLHSVGIATSGDTQQFVEIEGTRYSHIVDPATGVGLRDSASVTLIARDGTSADALATMVSVLPPERGLRLVDSLHGSAAHIVRRTSNGFQRFFSRQWSHLMLDRAGSQ